MASEVRLHPNTEHFIKTANLTPGIELTVCQVISDYADPSDITRPFPIARPNYTARCNRLTFLARSISYVAFRLFNAIKACFGRSDWQIAERSLKGFLERMREKEPAVFAKVFLNFALLIENEKSEGRFSRNLLTSVDYIPLPRRQRIISMIMEYGEGMSSVKDTRSYSKSLEASAT